MSSRPPASLSSTCYTLSLYVALYLYASISDSVPIVRKASFHSVWYVHASLLSTPCANHGSLPDLCACFQCAVCALLIGLVQLVRAHSLAFD